MGGYAGDTPKMGRVERIKNVGLCPNPRHPFEKGWIPNFIAGNYVSRKREISKKKIGKMKFPARKRVKGRRPLRRFGGGASKV